MVVECLVVGRGTSVIDWHAAFWSRTYFSFDANHFIRFVDGIRGDGHALVDWTRTVGIVFNANGSFCSWCNWFFRPFRNCTSARSFCIGDN